MNFEWLNYLESVFSVLKTDSFSQVGKFSLQENGSRSTGQTKIAKTAVVVNYLPRKLLVLTFRIFDSSDLPITPNPFFSCTTGSYLCV